MRLENESGLIQISFDNYADDKTCSIVFIDKHSLKVKIPLRRTHPQHGR